jgi:hypothetical protein
MENSGRLFEGDVIAPEQYLQIFTRTNNLEPEQELMLAILADAIECILKYCDEPIPMRAKLFSEAHEWLFDQDEKEPFSFLNVCEILNFDPSYLRRGIQARMRAKSVHGPEHLRRSTERVKRIGGGQVRLRSHSAPRSRAGL